MSTAVENQWDIMSIIIRGRYQNVALIEIAQLLTYL